ncbi:MAG: DDE-type integrase/transposase/recombinase [Paraglaciecola sp.]|nr:DDE-type integrase/transposase/recombinase [Paraglaciecola sp.]
MSMLALRQNANVELRGQKGIIQFATDNFVVVDFDEGGLKTLKDHDLADAIKDGVFKVLPRQTTAVITLTQSPQETHKYNVVKTTVEFMHSSCHPQSMETIKLAIDNAVSKHGRINGLLPSPAAAKRWYSKWIKCGQSVSYVLNKTKERRRSHFTNEHLNLIDEVIEREYLKFNGASVQETFDMYLAAFSALLEVNQRKIAQDNSVCNEVVTFKNMSRSAFYEYINNLEPYETDRVRLGVKAALKKYRSVNSPFITSRPLERVEIDAVHLNIAVKRLQPDGSFVLVRPIVYVAIDVFTRLIVGFTVDYSENRPGESSIAVANLIKKICNPVKKTRRGDKMYPLGGKPESIAGDSGKAFNAQIIQAMLQLHGIELYITQKASPWKKPFIERFFRTFKDQCCRKMPGYVGPRTRDTAIDFTLEQMAELTTDEFEDIAEYFFLEIYHNNPHRGLDGLTPLEVWNDIKETCPPQIPCDYESMTQFHPLQCSRVIQGHKGVAVHGLQYNCKELQVLFHKLERIKGKKGNKNVTVMHDTSDISSITVISPLDSHLIVVPCISRNVYEGLSLDEHKGKKAQIIAKRTGVVTKKALPRQSGTPNDKAKQQRKSQSAHDITQSLTQDENEQTMQSGIGMHKQNHTTSTKVHGTPIEVVKAKPSSNRKPSSRI